MARRRALSVNIFNSLWAVAFGVAMWALINENIRQVRENVPVDLTVVPPPGLVVVYPTPDGQPPPVTVSIQAPSSELAKRGEGLRLEATFDYNQGDRASEVQPGRDKALSLGAFRIPLEPEIQLVDESFDPPTVLVRLVQEASDDLAVRAPLVEVPAGWRARVTKVEPRFVRVSGPSTALAQAGPLMTRAIRVEEMLNKLGGWTPEDADAKAIPELLVKLDTEVASRAGLSFAQESVRVWIEVTPDAHERTLEIEPGLLKTFPFPGVQFNLKPAFGPVRLTLRGPRRLLAADGFPEQMRHRVVAVLDPETELRENSVANLEVYVYPPTGVEVKDAEEQAGRYVLPQKFTIEVEAP
jgi:hypothetical protein